MITNLDEIGIAANLVNGNDWSFKQNEKSYKENLKQDRCNGFSFATPFILLYYIMLILLNIFQYLMLQDNDIFVKYWY